MSPTLQQLKDTESLHFFHPPSYFLHQFSKLSNIQKLPGTMLRGSYVHLPLQGRDDLIARKPLKIDQVFDNT